VSCGSELWSRQEDWCKGDFLLQGAEKDWVKDRSKHLIEFIVQTSGTTSGRGLEGSGEQIGGTDVERDGSGSVSLVGDVDEGGVKIFGEDGVNISSRGGFSSDIMDDG